jgi:protoheme ferro-lyase
VAELKRVMKRRGTKLQLDVIDAWHDQPTYIRAMAERAKAALAKLPADAKPTILVSAHGLPPALHRRTGDPYCAHIKTCMDLILAQLRPTRAFSRTRAGSDRCPGSARARTR